MGWGVGGQELPQRSPPQPGPKDSPSSCDQAQRWLPGQGLGGSSWHRMWRWGWSPLAWPLPLQGAQWQLALRGESGWCAWNSSLEPQAPGLGPRTEWLVQAFPRVAWSQVPTLSLTRTTLDLYPGLVPLLGRGPDHLGWLALCSQNCPQPSPSAVWGAGRVKDTAPGQPQHLAAADRHRCSIVSRQVAANLV